MDTNKNARRMLLAAILVTSTILFSCDSTLGIFASVAAETANSTNLTKALETSSPGFVVHLGSNYYAGIGKLWSKPDNGTQWALHTVTGVSSSLPLAGSAVVVIADTTMYVTFADSTTRAGLGVWSTGNGTAWTRVDGSFPSAGQNLVRVLEANGKLFAITTNDRENTDPAKYWIYYFDSTNFISASIDGLLTGSSTIGVPTSVAWDNTDNSYVFTAGDVILTGTQSALTTQTSEPLIGGSAYSGVVAYDIGVIYATRTGYLHYSPNSSNATPTWITAGPFLDSGDDPYSLSAPTVINNDVLVVGTSSYPLNTTLPSYDGYLEFDVSVSFSAGMSPEADHSLISSAVDFDSSLTTRAVSSMPLVTTGTGYKLFALTSGYGLWSNTYTTATTSWGLWKRE
jgi:hypothetical protein